MAATSTFVFPNEDLPVIPRSITQQLINDWFKREQIIGLHSLLQCLQLGYAPDQPAVKDRHILASDIESAISLILRSPTPTIADNVYAMILEFVRVFSRNGKFRLFWTNSQNDWPDVINGPLRELSIALGCAPLDMQSIYGVLLQLRLISDTLAEERQNGKESSPGSLHATILSSFSHHDWAYFVSRVFKALSPMAEPSAPETAVKHASRKKRRRKSPVKQEPAEMTSNAMDISDPSAESNVDESWTKKRLVMERHVYVVRMALLELLENMLVILWPREKNLLDEIVSRFAELPTDGERMFFLNKFMASPSPRLALLDILLMQHFENNNSSLTRKNNATTSGGASPSKFMSYYWGLRPIRMSRRPEELIVPKSNYNILSVLLLHMLDALQFPSSFSPADIATSVEKARLLYNETKLLPQQETIFTDDEITAAIESAKDLYEFVSAMAE